MELRGKTILITRASTQSRELSDGLTAAGARVIECPAIEIVPVEDWSEVDRAAASLQSYSWVIFTSTNTVTHFLARLSKLGVKCDIPIAAIGTATAARLQASQLTVERIPHDFRAEGLLELFERNLAGVRVLIPRAESSREILPEELRRRGAVVDVVTVYRNVKPSSGLSDLRATVMKEKVDLVVFTSPSAIRNVSDALGDELLSTLGSITVAALGPVAKEAAEAVGLKIAIMPRQATIPELIQEIRSYFSSRTPNI